MAEKVAVAEETEEAKEPVIMPYNKDQDRPFKNPKVQFFKTFDGEGKEVNEWQTFHRAHRYWSEIDVKDQLNIIQYRFKHLPEKRRFRVIDEDGNTIREVNLDDEAKATDDTEE